MAFLIHAVLPITEPIDLINVAFENPRTVAAQNTNAEDIYNICPDRITGRTGWEELKSLSQDTGRVWRFVEVTFPHFILLTIRSIFRTKRLWLNEKRL